MYFSKKLDQFKGVRHCFFSRNNGFSKGKYKGLNCGRGSKDNQKTIQKNLRYVAKKMNVKKNNLILMHQTHSNRAIEIKKTNLKTLDLIERHIVLLMSEYKKIDAVLKNRKRKKYRPNIDEVEKQLKVLKGIDLIDDKYLSSLNKDFILLKGDYSPRTINYMKKCN